MPNRLRKIVKLLRHSISNYSSISQKDAQKLKERTDVLDNEIKDVKKNLGKVSFISGLAGVILGISCLSGGKALVHEIRKAHGDYPHLNITTHIKKNNEYVSLNVEGGWTYSHSDILWDHHPIARDVFYDSNPIIVRRIFGKDLFQVCSDNFGDSTIVKQKVEFLDNKTLLEKVFEDCIKKSYLSSKPNPPKSYEISIKGIDYDIQDLSCLVSGDTNLLQRLWTDKVIYSDLASK